MEERKLGDFLLEKKIGAGGMGEVFKARQVSLDRIVAVKVLPKSLAEQENFLERFQREAKAAANLIHPNVIQIYSIGVEEGIPYFAMEFVEGEDLQQKMRCQSFTYDEIVEIIIGVANALACAFEKDIVHRDIKPSNVMIDRNGIVKVMDFGLAKATKGTSNLTQSGLIMGTPNYISPEQGKGDPIDHRSDLYSLGVVFYELLTGQLPFDADTPAALIYKHAFETPPTPRVFNPEVPAFLEEICLNMLAKDPNERYANAKALLQDLYEFKGNLEYYIQGGERRAGAPHFVQQQTMVDKTGMARTSSLQSADTLADEEPSEAPTMLYQGESGVGVKAKEKEEKKILSKVLVAILVLVLVGGGIGIGYWALKPDGKSNGEPEVVKHTLPLSLLKKRLAENVTVYRIVGGEARKLDLIDSKMESGRYTFKFEKPGHESIIFEAELTAKGMKPSFQELVLDFKLNPVMRKLFEDGDRYFNEGKYEKAMEMLQKVKEVAPDYPGLKTLLSKAIALKEKETGRRTKIDNLYKEAVGLFRKKKFNEARALFRKIPDEIKDEYRADVWIIDCERSLRLIKINISESQAFLAQGELEQAKIALQKVTEIDPENEGAKGIQAKILEAKKLITKGRIDYDAGAYRDAIEKLEAFLKICPDNMTAKDMYRIAREKMDETMSRQAKLMGLLQGARMRFRKGEYGKALELANRILNQVDSNHKEAKEIKAKAEMEIKKHQVTGLFTRLDRYMLEGKQFDVAYLLDSSDKATYDALKNELKDFFSEALEIKKSVHKDMDISFNGDQAVVTCSWDFEVHFKELKKSTRGTLRQKIELRRAGSDWLFTQFTQIGELNVE
jgi:tetratricopeptide (TPR) repeat protein